MSKKGNILVEPSHESKKGKYGLITTLWNRDIVEVLFKNAKEELLKQGVHKENIFHLEVPGAFELPLSAKRLGKRKDIDAIIALGAIIKGETPHFDMIANSCATGLINVSLDINKPVIFGVLTTNNYEQALERADSRKGNKGSEAALSAMLLLENLSKNK